MKLKFQHIIILLFVFYINNLFAQNPDSVKTKKLHINGYLTDMQTTLFSDPYKDLLLENLIHNRINLNYQLTNKIQLNLEGRNRIISGQFFNYITDYDKLISRDNGFFDLNDNLLSGDNFVLNTSVDRANIELSLKKADITLGRQRINWGQCFAWNPNDIFNAYSFFDFDYGEKPGSDALRVQYYPTATSTAEIAVKADANDNITTALLYRFNKWQYDLQFLGGISNGKDAVAGAGWSGNIWNAGFRGEASYFYPFENYQDTTGTLIVAMGFDYYFKNSLFMQFEALYNQDAGNRNEFVFTNMNQEIEVSNLSFSEYTFLLNASYPATPLLNITVSGMYFPEKTGFYAGTGISYSLSDNTTASLYSQTFGGQFLNQGMDYINLFFMRLKMNF